MAGETWAGNARIWPYAEGTKSGGTLPYREGTILGSRARHCTRRAEGMPYFAGNHRGSAHVHVGKKNREILESVWNGEADWGDREPRRPSVQSPS